MSRDYLVRCCLSLVIIETENPPVRLRHLGSHDYFDGKGKIYKHSISEGHNILACTSLRYMMCETLILDRVPTAGDTVAESYHFLDYSSSFWSEHPRRSDQHDGAVVLAVRYLSLPVQRRFISTLKHCERIYHKSPYDRVSLLSPCDVSCLGSLPGLQMAVYLGFQKVVQLFVNKTITQRESLDSQSRSSYFDVETNKNSQPVNIRPWNGLIGINCRDNKRLAPLHWAARCGHMTITQKLLDGGADIDTQDLDGQTALHWAAKCGNKMVLEKLLHNGANWKSKDFDGRTSLHHAIIQRHMSDIELLAIHRNGQLLDVQAVFGLTALHLAVRLDHDGWGKGSLGMIHLLRKNGAKTDVCSVLGNSPLDDARKLGLDLFVELLQETNAYRNADTGLNSKAYIGIKDRIMHIALLSA